MIFYIVGLLFYLTNAYYENIIVIYNSIQITADESEVASERNGVEDEGSSSYASNEAVQYTDSYANYYATQWTPELYKQYGLPQDYFASQHAQRKPLRKQGFAQSMTDMLGEEAGVSNKG